MQPRPEATAVTAEAAARAEQAHKCFLGHVGSVGWVAHDSQCQAVDLALICLDELHKCLTFARLRAADEVGIDHGGHGIKAPGSGDCRPETGNNSYCACSA